MGKRTNEEREESAENSSASGTGRVGGCHRAMRCLVFASIWLGFLAALVLISLGLWTHCRNCLTIGVILIIACLGVAIHNCLRRGDATPTISIYLERDSHLSMECDDFETAELEEEIAELEAGERGEMEASGTPKCGSVNGGVTGLSQNVIANHDENGDVLRDGESNVLQYKSLKKLSTHKKQLFYSTWLSIAFTSNH